MAPQFFKRSHDGGPESGVTGFWLIEWKRGFSIVLLRFGPTHREAFHSHAFNAVTLWLRGAVHEEYPNGGAKLWQAGQLKYTPRGLFHRIKAQCGRPAWALSIRGPWLDRWQEIRQGVWVNLTHGREEIPA